MLMCYAAILSVRSRFEKSYSYSILYLYSNLKSPIMLYKVVQTFEPVDEILKCDQSNESYIVLSSTCTFLHDAVCNICCTT